MPEGEIERNAFLETLAWVCRKLEQVRIPFMITGGSAAGFWGHIRTTLDIDVVVRMDAARAGEFVEGISHEAYIPAEEVLKTVRHGGMFNIIHNRTCIKIDCVLLNEIDAYEQEKFSRRVMVDFLGMRIPIISPEDLILSKLLWSRSAGGSERQMRDCEVIYAMNKNTLDLSYLARWVCALGIESEYQKIQ